MKKVLFVLISAILVFTFAACDTTPAETTEKTTVETTAKTTAANTSTAQTREPKYGGVDSSGKTAAQIIEKLYEDRLISDAKANEDGSIKEATLVSFDYCKGIENDADNSIWEKYKDKNYYAVSTVLIACREFCNQDCALGTKGQTVERQLAYWLAMETEDSEWKIVDNGFPGAIDYADYAEDITFGEFTTQHELLTRDRTD